MRHTCKGKTKLCDGLGFFRKVCTCSFHVKCSESSSNQGARSTAAENRSEFFYIYTTFIQPHLPLEVLHAVGKHCDTVGYRNESCTRLSGGKFGMGRCRSTYVSTLRSTLTVRRLLFSWQGSGGAWSIKPPKKASKQASIADVAVAFASTLSTPSIARGTLLLVIWYLPAAGVLSDLGLRSTKRGSTRGQGRLRFRTPSSKQP